MYILHKSALDRSPLQVVWREQSEQLVKAAVMKQVVKPSQWKWQLLEGALQTEGSLLLWTVRHFLLESKNRSRRYRRDLERHEIKTNSLHGLNEHTAIEVSVKLRRHDDGGRSESEKELAY